MSSQSHPYRLKFRNVFTRVCVCECVSVCTWVHTGSIWHGRNFIYTFNHIVLKLDEFLNHVSVSPFPHWHLYSLTPGLAEQLVGNLKLLSILDRWHPIVLQSSGLDISSQADNIHRHSHHDPSNDILKKPSLMHSPCTYRACIKVVSKYFSMMVQIGVVRSPCVSQQCCTHFSPSQSYWVGCHTIPPNIIETN